MKLFSLKVEKIWMWKNSVTFTFEVLIFLVLSDFCISRSILSGVTVCEDLGVKRLVFTVSLKMAPIC